MSTTAGRIVALAYETYDDDGALEHDVDAQFLITLADGTELGPFSPTVENPQGHYEYHWTATPAGIHSWTGPTATHGIHPGDVLDVQPASIALLSLADAKAQLGKTTTVDDEELRGFINAATAVVESIVGPVVPRTVVEQQTGTSFLLNEHPVISVTSIDPYSGSGTSYVTADVLVNAIGEVTLASGGSFASVQHTVTYRAGRASIPPAISMAAKIIVQALWSDTQRGVTGRPTADEEMIPGVGFTLPPKAEKLLEPYRKAPAIA